MPGQASGFSTQHSATLGIAVGQKGSGFFCALRESLGTLCGYELFTAEIAEKNPAEFAEKIGRGEHLSSALSQEEQQRINTDFHGFLTKEPHDIVSASPALRQAEC
jgi:hypothetical protein